MERKKSKNFEITEEGRIFEDRNPIIQSFEIAEVGTIMKEIIKIFEIVEVGRLLKGGNPKQEIAEILAR